MLEAPEPPGRGLLYRIPLSMEDIWRLESTYPRRSSFVSIRGSPQRHEALAVRDGREQAGDGGPVELALPAAPDAPPVVFEPLGRGIEETSLGGGVDCGTGQRSFHDETGFWDEAEDASHLSRTWLYQPGLRARY